MLSELEKKAEVRKVQKQLVSTGAFKPSDIDDARRRVLRAILLRRGQPKFRKALLRAYEGRCAVTDCDAEDALEAAHIKPYDGTSTNTTSNGLLLRADIHTLFDYYLLAVEPTSLLIRVSPQLRETVYWEFDGRKLRTPQDPAESPNQTALQDRWDNFA